MWTNFFSTLIAGVAASFGTTLLSGVLVKGHDGVGYFNHGRVPACVSEAVKHSRRSRWVVVLDR